MSEQDSAALEESVTLDSGLDTAPEVTPEATTESATVDAEAQPKEDGFQKRINKVTADKYTEKRRADALQAEVDKLKAVQVPTTTSNAPKLEDFDYDQEKFNNALIDHRVNTAIAKNDAKRTQDSIDTRAQESSKTYNTLVSEFGKDDFHEVANKIPELDPGLIAELISTKEGVAMIYHLGEHLDIADNISNMSPMAAMAELGRISANMSAQPTIKPSAAPDPIEPLNSGGSISKERGPTGATFT